MIIIDWEDREGYWMRRAVTYNGSVGEGTASLQPGRLRNAVDGTMGDAEQGLSASCLRELGGDR